MATTRLPPDFKEFLRLLSENEVEYLATGHPKDMDDLANLP
jgi:hypothetical protein